MNDAGFEIRHIMHMNGQKNESASLYSNTHKINSNIHIEYHNMYFKKNDFKH